MHTANITFNWFSNEQTLYSPSSHTHFELPSISNRMKLSSMHDQFCAFHVQVNALHATALLPMSLGNAIFSAAKETAHV